MKKKIVKIWGFLSIAIVTVVILFLFVFTFYKGSKVISIKFLTQRPSGVVLGKEGGILPAIIGSLYFTGTAAVLGIPSIVLGLFSYSLLVNSLGIGRCILAGAVALAVMILPFVESRVEKALLECPRQYIDSSYALGTSKLYTLFKIVLPACHHEIISGILLGACFAMGATAPIIFTGGVAYANIPNSLFQPAMALPLHLYLLLAQGTTMPEVYGTAFVLMAIVLITNLITVFYTRRRKSIWK